MGNKFASGRDAIAICDVCGFRVKLRTLKELIVKTKKTNILACTECWTPDHPQLLLGMYPVSDPQALRNPRRDTTYVQSGVLEDGSLGEGSRIIQWGWNPVGGGDSATSNVPNYLVLDVEVGTVTVVTT